MAAGAIRRHLSPRHSTFLATWLVASLIFLVLCGLWTLATPIPSGPDEPTQYVKAAAVASGTLTGERPAGFPRGTTLVRVRGTFMLYDPSTDCYYQHPEVPAGCTVLPAPDPAVRETSTYVGEYPPLYYALTGLPSRLSTDPLARRAMRAISAVLSAVLLGLALSTAVTWSRSRWMVVAAAFTITPTAVYLASVLNPNGLEISAAIAAWTAAVLLVFEHADDPPPGLVAAFTGSSVVLVLTRPLSPLWLVCIVVALVVLRPAAARRLAATRAIRMALIATGAAAAVTAVWVVVNDSLAIEKFPMQRGLSDLQVASFILGRIPLHVRSLVGQFGAPEFTAPALAVLVWVVGIGALVCVAVSVAERRDAALLALIVVGVLLVLPFVLSFPDARNKGLAWQGRYQYPVAAGIPLIAGAILGATGVRMGRAGAITAVAVGVGQLATFYLVLRRYTVGLGLYANAFGRVPNGWEPPVPAAVLAGLVAVTVAVYCAWLLAGLGRPLPEEPTAPA
ncbi:MAG: DUF2142 domain-containing protein [Actinomycetota bacterium]|nr:DUF2142 domain-containing protein [Actinomycetota bacterium]